MLSRVQTEWSWFSSYDAVLWLQKANPDDRTPTFQLALHRAKDVSASHTALPLRAPGGTGSGERAKPGPTCPMPWQCAEQQNRGVPGAASAQGALGITQQMVPYSRFSLLLPVSYPTAPTSAFSRFYLVVILPPPHGGQRAEQRHSGAAGDRSPPSGAPPPGTELRRTHRGAGRVRCCLSVSRMEPTEAFPSTEGTRGVGDALSAFPAPVSLSSRCPERSFQLKTGKEGGGFEWDSAPPLRARSLRSPRLSAAPAPGLRAGSGCGAAFVPAPWPPPVPRAPQRRGDPTGGAASAHPKG